MTAVIVLLCVVLALVLLALIKCRVDLGYDEHAFLWRVAVGPVTIAPRAPKKERRTPRAGKRKETKAHRTPDVAQMKALAELVLRLLKRFFRALSIDVLQVDFLSAFDDPYNTAMAYGYAGSAMEAVTELAAGRIRRLELHTQPDFDTAEPRVQARCIFSVRLGTLFILAISALAGYQTIRRRAKKQSKKENEHGKSVDR